MKKIRNASKPDQQGLSSSIRLEVMSVLTQVRLFLSLNFFDLTVMKVCRTRLGAGDKRSGISFIGSKLASCASMKIVSRIRSCRPPPTPWSSWWQCIVRHCSASRDLRWHLHRCCRSRSGRVPPEGAGGQGDIPSVMGHHRCKFAGGVEG